MNVKDPPDLQLKQSVNESVHVFYDLRARLGRCRRLQSFVNASKDSPLYNVHVMLIEFNAEQRASLFLEDELERLTKIGTRVNSKSYGGDCILVADKNTIGELSLFYSIRIKNMVLRVSVEFIDVSDVEDAIQMSEPVIERFIGDIDSYDVRT